MEPMKVNDNDNINDKLYMYPNNNFAESIFEAIKDIKFGDNWEVVPLTSQDIAQKLKIAEIPIDYRAPIEAYDDYSSAFDGLAFDKDRVRSQSFVIKDNGALVGIMSFMIAPKKWIEKRKYFLKKDKGVEIVDAKVVTQGEFPEFYIIPGWTQMIPSHLGKFSLPGFHIFKNTIEQIQRNAPENTWMEVSAQGKLQNINRNTVNKILSDKERNTFIKQEELPFDIDLIGVNTEGSNSTVKMANMMGLKIIDNLGSIPSLGPVFAKKIN